MGKKRISTDQTPTIAANNSSSNERAESGGGLSFLTGGAAIDPNLASLFDKSAGPVLAPQHTADKLSVTLSREREKDIAKSKSEEAKDTSRSEVEEEESSDSGQDEEMVDADEKGEESSDSDERMEASAPQKQVLEDVTPKERSRKRKRGDPGDDLEESYMRRIEKEEARERKRKSEEEAKRRKVIAPSDQKEDTSESHTSGTEQDKDESEDSDGDEPPPMHESLTKREEAAALEKAARTVFLGNVSIEAIKSKSAKKTLLAHLSSFFPALKEASNIPPKIESIRFRSTPFSTTAKPKRAAYAKKEVMDSTTRSTNAYVVYNTVAAARKALSLNGSIVLDRHLRVDSVAHPAKVDHRRCVFVGNLGFVDEETTESDEDGDGKKKKRKKKEPADTEEGLWRTFNEQIQLPASNGASKKQQKNNDGSEDKDNQNNSRGLVEYVRVVRDRATRVGKGFAYVQFYDENAVEAALLLDGKKFPPLLPRKLRVTRAKRSAIKSHGSGIGSIAALDDKAASIAGRAVRLFGQAGAAKYKQEIKAKVKEAAKKPSSKAPVAAAAAAAPDNTHFVFEGVRASEKTTKFSVKTKSRGAKARRGKPKTRSARRAKAWKAKKKV
ncbi:hypothetical protein VTO42DRAFT_6634 [Malbranchea cinnamomea]